MGKVMMRLPRNKYHVYLRDCAPDMMLEWAIEQYTDIPFRYFVNKLHEDIYQYNFYYYEGGISRSLYYTTMTDTKKAIEVIEAL